jgi:hypothetical protein
VVQVLASALDLLGFEDSPDLGKEKPGTGDTHGRHKSANPRASPTPDRAASGLPTVSRKRRERRARASARKEEARLKAAEVKAAAADPGPPGDAAHHLHARPPRSTPPSRGGAARQQRSGGAAAAAEASGDARSTAACQGEAVRGSAAPPREPRGESSVYGSPLPSSNTGPGALRPSASSFVPSAVRSFDGSGAGSAGVKAKRALVLSPLQPGVELPYGGRGTPAKRLTHTALGYKRI